MIITHQIQTSIYLTLRIHIAKDRKVKDRNL